ncbi:Endosomal targeting BRO1-like domain-containing protein isoform 2 [Hibiscus syriacus]|uniref:Endosomal targeting BRO1-like domain-containing protein isoform 2 n=1 Tax=Hibiscus syriacus TaxID=106335 RepID=A0A6A2X1K0_HIBSY|nr:Endosomal targeting BRO1-like domain-containing protein isoform 2 [Hibiscus syriacus]
MQETTMSDSWYKELSVLHLMAVLLFSLANSLLLPNKPTGGYQKTSMIIWVPQPGLAFPYSLEDPSYFKGKFQPVLRSLVPRATLDIWILLCRRFSQLPLELRNDLPLDLTEGVLQSLCLQALGQGVEIQLGMAIDSIKATLAVKRRLACEMVKYWHQAHEFIKDLPLANRWGEKHKFFVQWKHIEAKAVAYYLHGLILEEGNTSADIAVAAIQAGEDNPPLWGASKYLAEKIPKDIPIKTIKSDSQKHELIMQIAPALPDLVLSLKPDEYQLPSIDPSWDQVQNPAN